MNEKKKKLIEALKKIEFKCSNEDVMQYMIAKYIVERAKEMRKKRVEKTLVVDALKICNFFDCNYCHEIDNTISKFNSDFKDVKEFEMYCYDLIDELESYSNEEEIEIRKNFKEDLQHQLEEHKDELSYEFINLFKRIVNDCFELSYDKFRELVNLFVKHSNVA
jgi:hypothetical protein